MKTDVKTLKESVDPTQVLENYDHGLRVVPEKAHGRCPFPAHHDGSPSFVMFLPSGYYKCSCGDGDIISFIRNIEECDFHKAVEILRDYARNIKKTPTFQLGAIKNRIKKAVTKIIPERSCPPSLPNCRINLPGAVQYFGWRRGYTPEQTSRVINAFNMMWAIKPYKDFIITPLNSISGEYRTFQAQATECPRPKKDKLFGPGSGLLKDCLFGLPQALIFKTDWCVVCEGIADVCRFWLYGIPAVGTLTASTTDDQAAAIISHFSKVYVGYDKDKAGENASLKLLYKLSPFVDVHRLAMLPGKDPDKMTPDEVVFSIDHSYRLA